MKKKISFLGLIVILALAFSTTVLGVVAANSVIDEQDNAYAYASETSCNAYTHGNIANVWCEVYYKFSHASNENDRGDSNGFGPQSVSGASNLNYGYVQSSRASAWLDGNYEEAFAAWIP